MDGVHGHSQHGTQPDSGTKGPLRLAVVSTPRSGNTWLRNLLKYIYQFDAHPDGDLAVHHPREVAWDALPDRCVLQLHWRPVEPFLSALERGRFRVIALARHPIDVLISILHFAAFEPDTARWLDGEGGDERSIWGKTPRSAAFLRYATSRRAHALLSVSREWWKSPGVIALRYEDLVRDTGGCLGKVAETVGVAPVRGIGDAVETFALDRVRPANPKCHYWQGRPGLWRNLLTASEAHRIGNAHRDLIRELGLRV